MSKQVFFLFIRTPVVAKLDMSAFSLVGRILMAERLKLLDRYLDQGGN